ncbi:MAG TPA: hypothetical protein PLP65_04500 [Bacteroidales bacterium]|nr:hypothetical protein [Bacteroidales bacterium]HOU98086.1 hypothetical protein [Bacteroidales bacterium]
MKSNSFFLFIVMSIQLYAQNPYKVISVNGEILAKKANIKLQSGVEVKSDDNFAFMIPNSRAALINPKLGRIILTEQNATDAFSKAAFAPAISSVKTRGMISNSIVSKNQLVSMFSDHLYVIDKLEIKINQSLFPMNNNAYFFIRYTYKGEEINKRLSFKSDTLILDKNSLYTIDGVPIPNPDVSEMKLYYYEILGENAKATFLSAFNLSFIDGEKLKSEVKIILDAIAKESYDKKMAEVYDYVTQFYGTVDLEYLENWVNKVFMLKK